MASLGQIYDLLREMGLIDGHRKEPITPEEVQQLNALLQEVPIDQLLKLIPSEDPPAADRRGRDQITDTDTPPWE